MKYKEAINLSLKRAMENPNVLLIGQGIKDFKGIWGTTLGLHKKYPDRIIETPIAEDSTAGICIGASLNGMYPINIHIRADFGLLIFNQLISTLSGEFFVESVFSLYASPSIQICKFSSFFKENLFNFFHAQLFLYSEILFHD